MPKLAIGMSIAVLLVSPVSFARVPGTYMGFDVLKTNTHSVKRDLRGNAGGGKLRITSKSLKVYGNDSQNGELALIRGDTRDYGARIYGGYQVNDYFALELEYNKYGDAKWKGVAGQNIDSKAYSVGMSTLGFIPVMNNLDFKAGFGLFYINTTLDMSGLIEVGTLKVNRSIRSQTLEDLTAKGLIGGRYMWNEHTSINFGVSLLWHRSNIDDVEAFELGLQYAIS